MFCKKCGSRNDESASFCRKCGTVVEGSAAVPSGKNKLPDATSGLMTTRTKDPDELTSNGIGGVIVGDGFFMVAVLLSVLESSVKSFLWLFLLIPAFYFFGRGVAEMLHARQILRREKMLKESSVASVLPPSRASVMDVFKESISKELTAGVTDRTTRDLK